MNEGLERVRAIIGSQTESGLEDAMIKDALWNEFFNVEHAVQSLLGLSDSLKCTCASDLTWFVEERERKHAAMERRGKP
jgi:hypothetical protein